jgi:hypothetical protein
MVVLCQLEIAVANRVFDASSIHQELFSVFQLLFEVTFVLFTFGDDEVAWVTTHAEAVMVIFGLGFHFSKRWNVILLWNFCSHVRFQRSSLELGVVPHVHLSKSLLFHVRDSFLLETFNGGSEPPIFLIGSAIWDLLHVRTYSIKSGVALSQGDGAIAQVLRDLAPFRWGHVLDGIFFFHLLVIWFEREWVFYCNLFAHLIKIK